MIERAKGSPPPAKVYQLTGSQGPGFENPLGRTGLPPTAEPRWPVLAGLPLTETERRVAGGQLAFLRSVADESNQVFAQMVTDLRLELGRRPIDTPAISTILASAEEQLLLPQILQRLGPDAPTAALSILRVCDPEVLGTGPVGRLIASAVG
jgi:hypothetical protein